MYNKKIHKKFARKKQMPQSIYEGSLSNAFNFLTIFFFFFRARVVTNIYKTVYTLFFVFLNFIVKNYSDFLEVPTMPPPKVQKMVIQPINLIFRCLQGRSKVQIWLYEDVNHKIEGYIIGKAFMKKFYF